MLEASFIEEVKLPNAKSVYELTKETHYHLLCSKCDKVQDIVLNLTDVTRRASNAANFNISKTDLVLSGLCENCS